MTPLYKIALLVFAAIFFSTLAVYVILRSRFARGKRILAQRLDRIAVGNQRDGTQDLSILKDESLSQIPTLNRLLTGLGFAGKLQVLMQQAGLRTNVGTFVLWMLFLAAGAFLAVYGTVGGLIPASAAGVIAGCLPYVFIRQKRRRRRDHFEEQLPEALDLIANALKSGFSFESALRMVGEELPDPLGSEFAMAFEEQNLGLGLNDALANLRRRIPSSDLDLFIIAIVIHKKTGGQLAEVLGNAAGTVRERFRLKRELKTKTVHSRFSGFILVILPIAMMGVMLLLNPEYIMILLDTRTGNYLLGSALVMQILGVWIIRRIIDIKM